MGRWSLETVLTDQPRRLDAVLNLTVFRGGCCRRCSFRRVRIRSAPGTAYSLIGRQGLAVRRPFGCAELAEFSPTPDGWVILNLKNKRCRFV